MSRKARKPIELEGSFKTEIKDNHIHINGPKGLLSVELKEVVEVLLDESDGTETVVLGQAE